MEGKGWESWALNNQVIKSCSIVVWGSSRKDGEIVNIDMADVTWDCFGIGVLGIIVQKIEELEDSFDLIILNGIILNYERFDWA